MKAPSPLFLVAILCAPLAGNQNPRSTAPVECSELHRGQTVTRKAAPITVHSRAVTAYAVVRLHRPLDDANADSCTVIYELFVREGTKPFSSVKKLSDSADGSVGVEIVGASATEKMIAADFWWAAGDYTGHRPVIYDVASKSAIVRALNDEISKRLPSCDYFEEFVAVTDEGEAVIRVPKSAYVEEGCPAQGQWLFNVRSGRVRRMK